MKYAKKLQVLLELNKVNGNIISIGSFSVYSCNITKENNKYYLNISPKSLNEISSSLYKIDLGVNLDQININNILDKITKQAVRLNGSEDRMENIKNIQNDEKFKKELETELKNLINKANNKSNTNKQAA
jgi:hypothetical protein